ncbi:MAG: helix-turn-helix domain-containing protein [Treponematales bacterium]
MTADEAAQMCNCTADTARTWAASNGAAYTGEGRRKTYNFTEADIERFRQRPKPGRRWPAETARKSHS